MAIPLQSDPIVFARDDFGQLIIPKRQARGLEAILILARSALRLWRDEWFLDRDAGMPYLETEDGVVTTRDAILGQAYDPAKTTLAVRRVLLAIAGVLDVADMRTSYDGSERALSISCTLRTQFGESPLVVALAA